MEDVRMTFLDHLAELRNRLMIISFALLIAGGVCFYYFFEIMAILREPLGEGIKLHYIEIMEPFMAKFKIAMFGGLFLASPIILYQVLAFLSPGLKKTEKRYLYAAVIVGAFLFVAGVIFGYYTVMPVGIQFLLGMAVDQKEFITPIISIGRYISFAGFLLMAFGFSFEFPVILVLLMKLGIISRQAMKANWRVVYVIILVLAAFLTPDMNPVNMLIMAAPMIILYHIAVVITPFI